MMATKDIVQEGIPLPLLTEKWFSQRFPEMEQIRVVDGIGEEWKRRKLNSIVVVAFHADLEVAQLKHFLPLFFVEELIDSGYSINNSDSFHLGKTLTEPFFCQQRQRNAFLLIFGAHFISFPSFIFVTCVSFTEDKRNICCN